MKCMYFWSDVTACMRNCVLGYILKGNISPLSTMHYIHFKCIFVIEYCMR